MGVLERKPGGPDNWVEQTGGLPKYIERIAKHLHYERGMSISHAIATAVNTVKRWARKGGVVKYGDRNNMKVTVKTQAQAAAALAQWEANKAKARVLPGTPGGGKMRRRRAVNLSEDMVTLEALAARANAIADPEARGRARMKVLELAAGGGGGGSAAPATFKGKAGAVKGKTATPGKSKEPQARGQKKVVGKRKPPYQWKHGFVPVTEKALDSKAKGSPVAKETITKKYGPVKKVGNATQTPSGPRETADKIVGGRAQGQTAKTGGTVSGRKGIVALRLREGKNSGRTFGEGVRAVQGDPNRDVATRASTAKRTWDSIPDNRRVVRNGKRYVIANVAGRQQLTPWVGVGGGPSKPTSNKRIVSIRTAQAESMTEGQIRKVLKPKGGATGQARAPLNKALGAKIKRRKIARVA